MRTGLILPVSNEALGIAFLLALVFTIGWLILHAIAHTNKASVERSFNQERSLDEGSPRILANNLSDLLASFPNRRVNLDIGNLVYWTNQKPLSISLAQAHPSSPPKVYLRVDKPARDLGHKICISDSEVGEFQLKLSAESLIFSDNNATFYPVDRETLEEIAKIFERGLCKINNNIHIEYKDGKSLAEWIHRIIQVHQLSTNSLLIGE